MSRIRIKNFGPIKEGCLENDGWLEINKVTIFIGNQGSGKSTVAKLISTFTWIEKALVRGDYQKKWFEKKNRLKNQFLNYHRLENYFDGFEGLFDNTEFDYEGEAYTIKYRTGLLEIIENKKHNYYLPQIMYVPAERNFIANVKSPKELKLSSDSLKEFLSEFDKAKNEIKGAMRLPINDVDIEYDKLNDIVNIKGNNYKLRLTEASSGFQSLVPLYLVSWFLANSVKKQSQVSQESMSTEELERFRKGVEEIWDNESLTEEQRRVALSVLSHKFNKSAFINIVEEPEQNLFPTSQKQMLFSLLEFNNMNEGNKLIMTTHSPYLINYLTLSVKADNIYKLLRKNKYKLSDPEYLQTNEIVPIASAVKADDLIIFELNERDGSIKKLPDYKGLPSDENQLNFNLEDSNELFAQLLEIQQGI
ncbi:MAG: AAA family ATPase [Bacteroidetes bacterium GWF2_38_335]|nr:MAG: AAA family ATPase [Bacteroidetes bacterium GWF2_38_335]OFY77701.1 MAG: AAA family ATPase [Bacteroidetes bacterium RIFOXYA12_FULL_38_20]HBS89068.1 AAA family ATPase [Bacteroidales bacterium]